MSRVKILRASAGSGKTYRLAYEYIRAVVSAPRSYASILAVTFTNKATEEMKSRIIAQLNSLANDSSPYMADLLESTGLTHEKIVENATIARSLILHDYSHFAISTIDKFFQQIVRGFTKELGLDFGYTVELHSDSFLSEAVDRLIQASFTDDNLSQLLSRVLNESVENAKGWDIRKDLVKIGKEILTERYQKLATPHNELIEHYDSLKIRLDESQRQLSEECEQIIELMTSSGLTPTDFKGSTKSFVPYFFKMAKGDTIDRLDRLEKAADNTDEWYSKASKRKSDILAIVDSLMWQTKSIIERYKEYESEKNSFELVSENFNRGLLINHISIELENLWAERNRLPIHQTTRLISTLVENTAIPFIYEKAGNRFLRYMIDEFQDTSTGQWTNFVPLLDDAISRSEQQPVMLIGDVKQAIYRWRGGDWNILAHRAIEYWNNEADYQEQLNTNWRSLPVVVNFNNNLIRHIVDSSQYNELKAVYDDFEQRADQRKSGGYVFVSDIEKDSLEQTVVEVVRDALSRGYSQRDIAFEVRKKKHGRQIADILLRNGFSIIDQESLLLNNSKIVTLIISILKLALHPEDMVSLTQFNRLTNKTLETPFESIELLSEIMQHPPVEALDKIITHFKLGDDSDNVSYLQALYQVVVNYSTENVPDISGFIDWWDDNGIKRALYLPSSQNAITIITIHKSKGLQYPIVVIPYCDWMVEPGSQPPTTLWANTDNGDYSIFNPAPITYKKSMGKSHYSDSYITEKVYSMIDAVNLLYVAVTRAERELYIFYGPKPGSKSIASLIQDATSLCKEYGQKSEYRHEADKEAVPSITFNEFEINTVGQRIRTSWDSQRFFEDGTKIETPISYGVLMHKIFSQIRVPQDANKVIETMLVDGLLMPQNAEIINHRISSIFENDLIASWFSDEWTLYNENAILIPNSSNTKRPDRVIVRDKQAVVVDYKFGQIRRKKYEDQTAQYKSLLQQMGYTDIRGYIWYVELNEVQEV